MAEELQDDMIFVNFPDILSVEQMQKVLGICRSIAYKLLKTGEIKAFKIGRIYKIPKKSVIDYIKKSLEQ